MKKARLARRAGRYARYQQVVEFGQQGMTPQEIAGRLGLSDRTVQNGLRLEHFLKRGSDGKNRVPLMPLLPLCSNGGKRENTRGLCSIERSRRKAIPAQIGACIATLQHFKQTEIQAPVNVERIKKYTPNTAVWLFVRDPKTLDEIEQEDLVAFCQTSTTLKRAYDLVQDFHADGSQERRISA